MKTYHEHKSTQVYTSVSSAQNQFNNVASQIAAGTQKEISSPTPDLTKRHSERSATINLLEVAMR
jgi:hypothetical protein